MYDAIMFVAVVIRTTDVLTLNVVLAAPAGIVTLAGTLAAELLLVSATMTPPAGAAALSVTVPVEDCSPPITLVGLRVNEARVGSSSGRTVSVAVLAVPA